MSTCCWASVAPELGRNGFSFFYEALHFNPKMQFSAAARLKITYASAQLNVDKLVKAEILREVSGNRRNRVYVAPKLSRLFHPVRPPYQRVPGPLPSQTKAFGRRMPRGSCIHLTL